jgi:hypothetical protein
VFESDIRIAFDSRLKAEIDTKNVLYPSLYEIPVTWENTPNKTGKFWIRTFLNLHTSENGVIGSQMSEGTYVKHEGDYIISIFIKTDTGTSLASKITNELVTLFQNKTFAGVWAKVLNPRKIGDDKHGYYHVNVLIPFTTIS